MEEQTWLILFVSLALGLLVGLQRESVSSQTAGIRSFPLVTLFGTMLALVSKSAGQWVIPAGLIVIAALLVTSGVQKLKSGDDSRGVTTELAVLLMFCVGVYLVFGEMAVAVVVTGVITVLLHFKSTLHGWVDKIGSNDLLSVMQFVLISMVVLPVLPNKTIDIYDVINPRQVWLMVVLIVGISLAGYFLYKIFGQKAGILLGGILGGLISSTASTLSYSKKSKSASACSIAAFVILTATAVSFMRVLGEIKVVAPTKFISFLIPLSVELLAMVVLVVIVFFRHRKEKNTMPEQGNPAQLKSALIFAGVYAAVTFLSAFVKQRFGNDALYFVSVISGLTDLDAITLSTARMTEHQDIEVDLGWRLILIATLSNLVFKAGLTMVFGNSKLARIVSLYFGLLIAAGLLLFFVWPS